MLTSPALLARRRRCCASAAVASALAFAVAFLPAARSAADPPADSPVASSASTPILSSSASAPTPPMTSSTSSAPSATMPASAAPPPAALATVRSVGLQSSSASSVQPAVTAPGLAPSRPQAESPRPGVLPFVAAVVPGVVVHGAGLWAAGDREASYRVVAAEGIGLGMMGAGAVPLILTDASGQNLDIGFALLLAGAGLFLTSALADLYGASIGERPNAQAPTHLPVLEPCLGHAFVYDRLFPYRHFAVMRIDARLGGFRMSPELWQAVDDDHRRIGLDTAFRFVGPTPERRAPDGSFVDIQGGVKHQRFGTDGFSILTTEVLFPTRLDLRRLGRSLAGSFVDFDLGWAFQFYDYWAAGRGLGTDINGMLLARFGYGLYFGGPSAPRGEAQIYYDHRHDDFAGGLAVALHEPNVFGHVGVAGKVSFGYGWAMRAQLEVGSAFLARWGLIYAWGGGS
jgi:hypothetical protein